MTMTTDYTNVDVKGLITLAMKTLNVGVDKNGKTLGDISNNEVLSRLENAVLSEFSTLEGLNDFFKEKGNLDVPVRCFWHLEGLDTDIVLPTFLGLLGYDLEHLMYSNETFLSYANNSVAYGYKWLFVPLKPKDFWLLFSAMAHTLLQIGIDLAIGATTENDYEFKVTPSIPFSSELISYSFEKYYEMTGEKINNENSLVIIKNIFMRGFNTTLYQINKQRQLVEKGYYEKALTSPYVEGFVRISLFLHFYNEGLLSKYDKDTIIELFIKNYITVDFDFDSISEHVCLLDLLSELTPKSKYHVANAEWVDTSSDIITVYRGENMFSREVGDCFSWTTDLSVAKWFSQRFGDSLDGNAKVYTATVHKDNVCFATNEREEYELFILPQHIKF